MDPATVASPVVWALILSGLVVLGYILHQARAYRLLCYQQRRLQALRGGQRQVYRTLELCQASCEVLFARVPHAVRPAPYTDDDTRAIALRAELAERLAALRRELRPLQAGPLPAPSPLALLAGRYRRELRAAERELAFAKGQRRELAGAEALVDELEAVLARVAQKPQEEQRAFADLQAMAEALSEEIELEQRAGTEGLVPLVFEARAVRASALAWAERLGKVSPAEAAEAAIQAEVLRPQLMARLNDLYARVGDIAGIHDQALRGLERLGAAVDTIRERLAGLRPALAQPLSPALEALERQHRALRERYGQRDVSLYGEVSRQAWALVSQARSLDRQYARLAEVDQRATSLAEECSRAVDVFRRQVEDERAQARAQLDLADEAQRRLARYAAQMQAALAPRFSSGQAADPAMMAALLGEVEALAAASGRELAQAVGALATWQRQRAQAGEALARLETLPADQAHVSSAWRELQAYSRANWPQLEADWHERCVREQQEIAATAAELRTRLGRGQFAQSDGEELQRQCESLERRRQRLVQEGQRVRTALRRVQAMQRQVQEGIAGLRADLEAVATVEQELPPDLEAAGELRALCREILSRFRRVEDEARWPARADLQRLCNEEIAGLHDQLAMQKLSYVQLVEGERAALRRQLAHLWEAWEPLGQRLAKASPASEVDHASLARRWESVVQAARSTPAGLKQVLELKAQAEELAQEVGAAEQAFQAERETVRQAEIDLARERRAAAQVRESLPKLLGHPHPQVVDEEWERSTKSWRRGEAMLRRLEPHRGAGGYLARLDDAVAQYREARTRAHSALVRLLRYAFLEDPEGMHEACLPLGRRWGRLGVTAREAHIRDLLSELEQAGQLARLIDRVGSYLAGRSASLG